jgi:hypothetical protein
MEINYKILLGILALVVFSASVSATSLTVVSGTITDNSNVNVADAAVTVTCTHLGVDTVKNVISGVDGKYYAFIPQLNCAVDDNVLVQAVKDDATGQNNGVVSYNSQCKINTALIDVQIPEFGVIAGGLALLGALGVVIYRRKN